jgi:DNA-binding transcriptional MerR regulator
MPSSNHTARNSIRTETAGAGPGAQSEMSFTIPDKLYFKIGEVSSIVGVKPYVLRYWETEFDLLKPGKAPSRHRLYKRKDVEMLLTIKELLYSEGYTIDGARKKLKQRSKDGIDNKEQKSPPPLPLPNYAYKEVVARIKEDLASLQKLIS